MRGRSGMLGCVSGLIFQTKKRIMKNLKKKSKKYTQIKTSPQAKRHKLSLLFTSLTISTSLTFINKKLISQDKFYH